MRACEAQQLRALWQIRFKESDMTGNSRLLPMLARRHLAWAVPALAASGPALAAAAADTAPPASMVTHYRTKTIDGITIFYREAGPPSAPVVVLLHGFPTSSHMFRNLIPALADRYHVIAPDYPGFGQSDMPDRASFAYTFDRFGELVGGLVDALGVGRYSMYVMDYGAPVGWRLALRHPERISALIVQNGNAYEEGLKAFWDPIKAYWSDHSEAHRKALYGLVSPETTKFQYTDGVADVTRISPDNWVHDQALLDRPGNAEIQMDLFYDYRTNLPLYPAVQAWFRKDQPPTLIVWGKNDKIFPADGAYPYKRDLKKLDFHLLDTGHFVLEDRADEAVPLIRGFLAGNATRG
jgi:pimeloyl-ACP methyl ester carboxylesterase